MESRQNEGYRSSSTGRTLWALVRYSGLVLFGALILSMDWGKVAVIAREADSAWILVAGALNVVFIICKSIRWHSLLALQGIRYKFWRAIKVYQASSFFSVITPGRVGDVIKASFLKKDLGVAQSLGMVSVVIDRVLDLLMLAGTSVLMILLVSTSLEMLWATLLFALLAIAGTYFIISAPIFSAALRVATRLPGVGGRIQSRKESLEAAHQALRRMFGVQLLIPVVLSVAAYTALYLGGYALARALSLPLSLIDCAYCIALANVVSLLPISVSGIGTRDMTMVVLFKGMGLGQEQALIYSFGYLVVNLIFSNGLGAFYWFREPAHTSYQRQAADLQSAE